MSHTQFSIGQIVSNDEMCAAYKIGNSSGMRKSNIYNCLVPISDHTKGLYEDKWYGDVLHYNALSHEGVIRF